MYKLVLQPPPSALGPRAPSKRFPSSRRVVDTSEHPSRPNPSLPVFIPMILKIAPGNVSSLCPPRFWRHPNSRIPSFPPFVMNCNKSPTRKCVLPSLCCAPLCTSLRSMGLSLFLLSDIGLFDGRGFASIFPPFPCGQRPLPRSPATPPPFPFPPSRLDATPAGKPIPTDLFPELFLRILFLETTHAKSPFLPLYCRKRRGEI